MIKALKHIKLRRQEIMNKKKIISGFLILIGGIYFYYFNSQYTGKYIGFKCGSNNENNIFILKNDGTFIFKSDNLSDRILGEWYVSEEENITFRVKQKKIEDIGSIVRYNLHTNREQSSTNIPYANGCAVYVRAK